MAALTELISEVFIITNRPDLSALTEQAVKAATLKAHHSDFYPKDLAETGISFSSPAFYQELEVKSIIPRFRALKYLRKFDPVSNRAGKMFEVLTPGELFDAYGCERTDVIYFAGSSYEIKSSTEFQYCLLGHYLHPIITSEGYSSWVADEHPFAIIYEAARAVFKAIGYDEQEARYERLMLEQLKMLKTTQLTLVGY